MTQAIFCAVDPFHRNEDRSKLRYLLADIRGVKDWTINSNGEVIVDYSHAETSSNVIEEALAGVGYRIKHVHDDARLGKADRPNDGIPEEKRGNKSYGKQDNKKI